jgi:hypothetical protein
MSEIPLLSEVVASNSKYDQAVVERQVFAGREID